MVIFWWYICSKPTLAKSTSAAASRAARYLLDGPVGSMAPLARHAEKNGLRGLRDLHLELLAKSVRRGRYFLPGDLLCLIDEPMKQNHKLAIRGEHRPRDPVWHLGADFLQVP